MFNAENLKQTDPLVLEIINRELLRQNEELELIASENYASASVLEAMASVLANKYSEGYSGHRYYGGNQIIDEIEDLAVARAKELFGAAHVNVQPLSGSPANAAVYMAFLEPGDKVLGLRLDHGGHLSHGHAVNFSGRLYNFVQYGVNPETGIIDMDEVREIALREKPKMIVAGFSAYSREIDWQKFKDIADEVGAYTFADIAHIAGLIAGKAIPNPVPYFDIVTTTTHKTLRGPRGGMIMCKKEFAKAIDKSAFPGFQGGPHMNNVAAKAVAFGEALKPSFKTYAKQIIKNAKVLEIELKKHGFKLMFGGTDNHMVLVDVFGSKGVTGKEAEEALDKIGITLNKNMIPDDPRSPFDPSGVRIGVPAITTRGMKEKEIKIIAKWIKEAIENHKDEKFLKKLHQEVIKLCKKFPIYKNLK